MSLAEPIELEPGDYRQWREAATAHPHWLLDIREPWEREVTAIGDDHHIPMNEVPLRVGELPMDRDIVVYCHHGVRSFQVAYYLRQQGYGARSLSGGIARWSEEIDPSIATY